MTAVRERLKESRKLWPLAARCKKCGYFSRDPWVHVCLRKVCGWEEVRFMP